MLPASADWDAGDSTTCGRARVHTGGCAVTVSVATVVAAEVGVLTFDAVTEIEFVDDEAVEGACTDSTDVPVAPGAKLTDAIESDDVRGAGTIACTLKVDAVHADESRFVIVRVNDAAAPATIDWELGEIVIVGFAATHVGGGGTGVPAIRLSLPFPQVLFGAVPVNESVLARAARMDLTSTNVRVGCS